MLRDEGYIKYNCLWTETAAVKAAEISGLNMWRKKLFQKGLLGVYPDGIAFGNVSIRKGERQFMITASQTGKLAELNADHFALVTDFDLKGNSLICSGAMRASSESLSHAAIYTTLPNIKAVFHVHHAALWQQYLHKLPTTDVRAAYGTPEMAFEIRRIVENQAEKHAGILFMAGHEEGIISYGETLALAGNILLNILCD